MKEKAARQKGTRSTPAPKTDGPKRSAIEISSVLRREMRTGDGRHPQLLNPKVVTQLQDTIGNRAVRRLLDQPRPKPKTDVTESFSLLQRRMGFPIQAKLTVGPVNDVYEREAAQTAKQVVNLISSQSRQPVQQPTENETVQAAPVTPFRQRQAGQTETGLEYMHSGSTNVPDLESAIQTARGGGQSLDNHVRVPMEQAFGADLSGVRIHDDAQSDILNRSLHAQAFTTGQDIFFRQGGFSPRSPGGQELLAHELTHVVQQNGDRVQRHPDHEPGDRGRTALGMPFVVSAAPGSLIQRAAPPGFEFMSAMPTPAPVAAMSANVATQATAADAADQLYTNYWNYAGTHWTYNASGTGTDKTLLQGTATQAHCGALSNSYLVMAMHLVDSLPNALKAGFTRSRDTSMASDYILTNRDLTLVGQNPKSNVKTEINGATNAIAADNYASRRFYFYQHWRVALAGVMRDPLFNVDADDVSEQAGKFKRVPTQGDYNAINFDHDTRLIPDPSTVDEQLPCFGLSYILLSNASAYDQNKDRVKDLHKMMNAGWIKQAWKVKKWKPAQTIKQKCVDLIASITNIANFKRVLEAEDPAVHTKLEAIEDRAAAD